MAILVAFFIFSNGPNMEWCIQDHTKQNVLHYIQNGCLQVQDQPSPWQRQTGETGQASCWGKYAVNVWDMRWDIAREVNMQQMKNMRWDIAWATYLRCEYMRYVTDLRSVEVGCFKSLKLFRQLLFPGNPVCDSKSQIYHRLCRSFTSAKL